MLEQKLKRNITKSRPYFEEKAVCQSQLDAQKQRVGEIQTAIAKAKAEYAASLRQLESISEEIHLRRKYKVSLVVLFIKLNLPFRNILYDVQ